MPTATTAETLVFAKRDSVATITLNRPNKLNTVTPEMGRELQRLVTEINDDDTVRVVILTGAGEKAFSAGSDVKVLDEYGTNWKLRNRIDYARAIGTIRKPVVAAIRGYAIGGGLEMALNCDVRFATPSASFGAGEIKLGWVGGAGNTQLLPRLVGYGKAMQYLLTGDLMDAAEAHRVGLIQEIVPEAELEEFTAHFARRVAANAPIATELVKHLVKISESTTIDVGLAYENDLFTYCFTTQDSQEGIAAFREKRPARFLGR